MRHITTLILFILLTVLLAGCGNTVSEPAGTSGNGGDNHDAAWSDSSSPDFHGEFVKTNDPTGCKTCHGSTYQGKGDAPSCYQCHDGPGGHPVGWRSSSVHGSAARSGGTAVCAVCHGSDYRGGWAGVSCYQCHGGPNP